MRSGNRTRASQLDVVVTIAFAALVLLGTLRHEMWRDEHQAWLVGRDAATPWDVVRNLAYDGHPVLWHELLFVLTRFTHDPRAMQLLHALLATLGMAVLIRRAPFPTIVRYAIPFGYFPLFEYGLISRSYVLSVLLTFAFCALTTPFGERSSFPWRVSREASAWLVLALLANTHVFGLLVSLPLLAWRIVTLTGTSSFRPSSDERRTAGPPAGVVFTGLALYVIAAVFSVWCIIPKEGGTFPLAHPRGVLDTDRLRAALAQVGSAYLYLPDLRSTHFWNSHAFPETVRLLLGAIVFLAAVLVFSRRPAVLVAYLTGTVLFIVAQYWTDLMWIRYSGFHWLLLVACTWLFLDSRAGQRRAYTSAVLAALGLHLVAGLYAWVQDVRAPFSRSQEAAAFLRPGVEAGQPLVGATDFIVSPLTSLLDTRMYCIERAAWGSFVIWDARRKRHYSYDDLIHAVETVMNEPTADGRPRDAGLLVLSLQPKVLQDGVPRPIEHDVLDADLRMDLVRTFPPAIVEDEQYFIYSVRRVARAGETPGE